MVEPPETIMVILTRIEGALNLSNLRHDQTDTWKGTVDVRFREHGERLGGLEIRERERAGEVRGATSAVKLLWAIGGGGVIAAVAAVFRSLGV